MLYFPDNLPKIADGCFFFFQVCPKISYWVNEKQNFKHDMTHDSSQKQNRTVTMAEAILNMQKKKGTSIYNPKQIV